MSELYTTTKGDVLTTDVHVSTKSVVETCRISRRVRWRARSTDFRVRPRTPAGSRPPAGARDARITLVYWGEGTVYTIISEYTRGKG